MCCNCAVFVFKSLHQPYYSSLRPCLPGCISGRRNTSCQGVAHVSPRFATMLDLPCVSLRFTLQAQPGAAGGGVCQPAHSGAGVPGAHPAGAHALRPPHLPASPGGALPPAQPRLLLLLPPALPRLLLLLPFVSLLLRWLPSSLPLLLCYRSRWPPFSPPASLPQERGVVLYESNGGVAEVQPGALVLADGQRVPFDECLWSTQASATGWLGDTGLPVDAGESHTQGGAGRMAGKPAGAVSQDMQVPGGNLLLNLPICWPSLHCRRVLAGGRVPAQRRRAAQRVCRWRCRLLRRAPPAKGGGLRCARGAWAVGLRESRRWAPSSWHQAGRPAQTDHQTDGMRGRCRRRQHARPSAPMPTIPTPAGRTPGRKPAASAGRRGAAALEAPGHLSLPHQRRRQVCRRDQGLAG